MDDIDDVGDWHAKACPLYEISESDCAYDWQECECGWQPADNGDER